MPEQTADLLSCWIRRGGRETEDLVEFDPTLHLVDSVEGEE